MEVLQNLEMNCSFNFTHYADIIKLALQEGYKVCSFQDYIDYHQSFGRVLVLRHDIDRKIKKALKMAKIERDHLVTSTYFFRLHAKYNLFEYKNYNRINKIVNMNHEVALHLESQDFADCFGVSSKLLLEKELQTMNLIGFKPRGIAEHGTPNKKWDNHFFSTHNEKSFDLEYHAKDKVFGRMKYLSDSGGKWREGCICNHIGQFEKIQVLIHPNHWFDVHYSFK